MRHSDKHGLQHWAELSYLLPVIAWAGLTVLFLFYVFRYVDLRPRVDENFFFSSSDPQVQNDALISKMFLQTPELILSARGNIRSHDYLRKVGELSNELSTIPEIDSVQSLTRGPRNTDDALKSPLWKRVLFAEDQKATFIYVFMKEKVSVEDAVLKIEKSREHFDSPDFRLMISGASYIV